MEEEIDNRDGAKCVVLSNKDKDRLWFSASEPHRLIRREVEVELPVFRKENIVYSDYREDNLPHKIVSDITQSRTSSNSPKEHRSIEYTIKTWKTEINPNESFVVKPTDDVAILDVDSRISYQWFSNRNQPFKNIINSYKNIEKNATH